jgi:peptidoglycan/LPS O-acetylase OafA/YrhL
MANSLDRPKSQLQLVDSRAQTAGITEEKPFRLGYRPWLDGLRGCAILLVLAYHLHLIPGGSFGVDIFFVLSGFLITSLLAEEWRSHGSISLPRFYLRRLLRLFPALLTLLLVGFVYTLLFRPTGEAAAYRKEMVVAVCYVSNWPSLHRTAMSVLGHTWSLSVEEQFYLIWPMLLFVMLRAKLAPRTIILVVLAGILGSASLRAVLFSMRPPAGPERQSLVMRLYAGLDTRADALLMGCLVGLLATGGLLPRSPQSRRPPRLRSFQAAIRAGALVSALALSYLFSHACFNHHQYFYGMYTVVALMVAVIIVCLLTAPPRLALRVLESGVLVGVGRISYGLYLFHIPVIHWLRLPSRQLGWTAPGKTLLATGVSFAAALISFYLVERPCLLLKLRLHSPESRTPTSIQDEAALPVQVAA